LTFTGGLSAPGSKVGIGPGTGDTEREEGGGSALEEVELTALVKVELEKGDGTTPKDVRLEAAASTDLKDRPCVVLKDHQCLRDRSEVQVAGET
jgi:hypothetical protein